MIVILAYVNFLGLTLTGYTGEYWEYSSPSILEATIVWPV